MRLAPVPRLRQQSDLGYPGVGRPVSLLNFDLAVAPAIFDYIASLVETAHSTLTTNTPGLLSYTLNQPYGVTAGEY